VNEEDQLQDPRLRKDQGLPLKTILDQEELLKERSTNQECPDLALEVAQDQGRVEGELLQVIHQECDLALLEEDLAAMKDQSPVIMMTHHLPVTEEEAAGVKEMLLSLINVLVCLDLVSTPPRENWKNSLDVSVALRNAKLFLMDTQAAAVASPSYTLKRSTMQMPPGNPWTERS